VTAGKHKPTCGRGWMAASSLSRGSAGRSAGCTPFLNSVGLGVQVGADCVAGQIGHRQKRLAGAQRCGDPLASGQDGGKFGVKIQAGVRS